MDTMFLIYADEARRTSRTPEERAEAILRHWTIMDDAKAQGKLKGVSPLQAVTTAMSVRVAGDGKITTTDGPFAETKEVLGGYYILDCTDIEEAKYWAGRIAQTGCALTVEIRPLAAIPSRAELAVPDYAHA